MSLREAAVKPGDGCEFAVLGDHDADVALLAAAVRKAAEGEIRRCYLRPGAGRADWRFADDQVAGRLEYDPDGGPTRAIVDGRPLTWDQIGETLAEYEGWRFRLILDEPAIDLR